MHCSAYISPVKLHLPCPKACFNAYHQSDLAIIKVVIHRKKKPKIGPKEGILMGTVWSVMQSSPLPIQVLFNASLDLGKKTGLQHLGGHILLQHS